MRARTWFLLIALWPVPQPDPWHLFTAYTPYNVTMCIEHYSEYFTCKNNLVLTANLWTGSSISAVEELKQRLKNLPEVIQSQDRDLAFNHCTLCLFMIAAPEVSVGWCKSSHRVAAVYQTLWISRTAQQASQMQQPPASTSPGHRRSCLDCGLFKTACYRFVLPQGPQRIIIEWIRVC